jgi:integrase
MSAEETESLWESTTEQNLVRYRPSGTYFARYKVGGKPVRKSLKTDVFSVAKLRLPDELKKERKAQAARRRFGNGRMTVGDAVQAYREKIAGNPGLKPRSKDYYLMVLKFIERSWPGLFGSDVREITEADCKTWLAKFRKSYSASVVNNAIGVLRAVFQETMDAGGRLDNPAQRLKRTKVRPKALQLPSRAQFLKFVAEIDSSGAGQAHDCADFVRFLAYSGCRLQEAANVTWRDLDFEKGRLHVRGDPQTGTKNSEMRWVPMIPELKSMLENLRAGREDESLETPIMRVRECQKSMDRGAALVGMKRITHHDLRHLFATICIESGVDIPTVSRWLGHKDGGVLAMKTYGHLRDEHSLAQARKVTFRTAEDLADLRSRSDGTSVAETN